MALIEGLKSLLDELSSSDTKPGDVGLIVRGDSRLVLKQVAGEWKIKNATLKALNSEVRVYIQRFGEVRYIHQDRSETVRALGH